MSEPIKIAILKDTFNLSSQENSMQIKFTNEIDIIKVLNRFELSDES